MSKRHHTGLRILFWLACHLLDDAVLSEKERALLESLSTALYIVRSDRP